MKTENEIIKETIEFYWADPENRRATSENGCHYVTADGRMCAVGRCLTPEHATCASTLSCGVSQLPSLLDAALDEIFQPEYQAHPVDFWEKLQNVHDSDSAWEDEQVLRRHLDFHFPNFPLDTLNLVRA